MKKQIGTSKHHMSLGNGSGGWQTSPRQSGHTLFPQTCGSKESERYLSRLILTVSLPLCSFQIRGRHCALVDKGKR